jgi:hypothetical protein
LIWVKAPVQQLPHPPTVEVVVLDVVAVEVVELVVPPPAVELVVELVVELLEVVLPPPAVELVVLLPPIVDVVVELVVAAVEVVVVATVEVVVDGRVLLVVEVVITDVVVVPPTHGSGSHVPAPRLMPPRSSQSEGMRSSHRRGFSLGEAEGSPSSSPCDGLGSSPSSSPWCPSFPWCSPSSSWRGLKALCDSSDSSPSCGRQHWTGSSAQPPRTHPVQQLANMLVQAVPPVGGWHSPSLDLIEHLVWPLLSVRQQVTAPGRPQVDRSAHSTTFPRQSWGKRCAFARCFATAAAQETKASLLGALSQPHWSCAASSAAATAARSREPWHSSSSAPARVGTRVRNVMSAKVTPRRMVRHDNGDMVSSRR